MVKKYESSNLTRNSNIELLRIISIILIIAHHYSVHGFPESDLDYSFNKYILDILSVGGKIGVSCFILISGYFMVDGNFSIKKLWMIEGELLFYSIGMFGISCFCINPSYDIKIIDIKKAFCPFLFSTYGFITCFLILMILSKYLNVFLRSLCKEELKAFILTSCVIWSIFTIFLKANMYYSDIIWYFILYCMAAYIKLHVTIDENIENNNKKVITLSIIILLTIIIGFNYIGYHGNIDFLKNNVRYFNTINSPFICVISTSLFSLFIAKPNYNNRFINNISKSTLGVYLIHDNYLFRTILWNSILKNKNFISSPYLVFHAIASITIVFIICTAIDAIRILLFEKCWKKVYEMIHHCYCSKQFDKNIELKQ